MMKHKKRLLKEKLTKKVRLYIIGEIYKKWYSINKRSLFLAGVLGEIVSFIGNDQDYLFNGKAKTYYWIYELHVNKLMDSWPESNIRQRDWVRENIFLYISTTVNMISKY